jgi:isoleucyl-tRNA synthetase
VDSLPELHRPWIDEITITCPECGETVSRIPEVGDVWLDAGITPFSTLGYFTDRKGWEKWFPAEWVIEMNEQVRLWFYSLLFRSVTLTGRAPYEQVMTHGSVVQENGSKFHKSGFMIRFDEAAERIGADAVRYLYAGANTSSDVRFGFHLGDEARRKLLGFWNIYTFFMTYAELDKPTITDHPSEQLIDKWLENRVQYFVSKAVKSYENYNTPEIIREFETCVDDVSNWYVRLCRRRFWKGAYDEDKRDAYNALYRAVKQMTQTMAPIIPFMTETIWQKMIVPFGGAELSVHLSDFPKPQEADQEILKEVEKVREIIAGGMKLRNENQLNLRQPLAALYVDASVADLCRKYAHSIKDELNVKALEYVADWSTLSDEVLSLDFRAAGRVLKGDVNKVKQLLEQLSPAEMAECAAALHRTGEIKVGAYTLPEGLLIVSATDKAGVKRLTDGILLALNAVVTPELKAEGAYREILRNCQVLRKEAGFAVSDWVTLQFTTDHEFLQSVLEQYGEAIQREALANVMEIETPVMIKNVEIENGTVSIAIQ